MENTFEVGDKCNHIEDPYRYILTVDMIEECEGFEDRVYTSCGNRVFCCKASELIPIQSRSLALSKLNNREWEQYKKAWRKG